MIYPLKTRNNLLRIRISVIDQMQIYIIVRWNSWS